ncbi:DUF4267 domain-containing protein [Fibrisoma montanum]|uniref:DUF4267 domain-containing protein n=1 Tax=Fibrisoma montanum TaxID=2305895 RepID=A0A418M109_9BACT|nr:DUF4267 domain-containing protein [Fibrisoma montanum]RIV19379.1 DUF4267 domain-containing protein [Fibrisoma montanum]
MQTKQFSGWITAVGYLFGAGLVFIGGRFLLAPEVAERGYGLVFDQPTNAFHYIKGIRDVFSGLLFIGFTAARWFKPLGGVTLAGSLIPVVDMLIVLSDPHAVAGSEWIHGGTAIALWVYGYVLFRNERSTHQPQFEHTITHRQGQ